MIARKLKALDTDDWLFYSLLAGVSYYVVARLSLYLAIPPSEASAVWPAAGIAVGGLVAYGRRILPGLAIGILLFYLQSWMDTSSPEALIRTSGMSLLLVLGPLLQAILAMYLIKPQLGDELQLIDERSVLRFVFFTGPVACLVSASINIGVLHLYGFVSATELADSWLTWWVGDTIGVTVVAPLVIVLLGRHDVDAGYRRLAVGLPMLLLITLVIIVFRITHHHTETEFNQEFDKLATVKHQNISNEVEHTLSLLRYLKGFFESSSSVTAEDFKSFTRPALLNNPHIKALEWIPRITSANRQKFEAETGLRILEPDADGAMQAADFAEEYYVIRFAAPMQGNEKVLGYNILKNPEASTRVRQALNTNLPAATTTFRLLQETDHQDGLVIYMPVFDMLSHGKPNLGVVAVVLRVEDFIRTIIGDRHSIDRRLDMRLVDLTDGVKKLYETSTHIDSDTAGRSGGLMMARTLNIAGRLWQVEYYPSRALRQDLQTWSSWVVLIGGMLLASILGGWLLSLTGRNIKIRRLVEAKTAYLIEEIERREVAEAESRKLSLAVEHSPNMVMITDAEGNIEYVNPRFCLSTGYDENEIKGQNIQVLHAGEGKSVGYRTIWQELEESGEWHGEILNANKDGEMFWAEVNISAMLDDEGVCSHYVVVQEDVTESRSISEKLSYQATHDQLTGLINRREFERRLDYLMDVARADRVEHAFCFMDLDQFKVVNDTSGHVAGDELLRQLGDMLQRMIRKNDMVARLGGDEFGILMENCSLFNAQRSAEHIREAVDQFRFSWDDRVYSIGVSIGLVSINGNSQSSTEVFKRADSACYAAKDSGRNRIHLYAENDELLNRRSGEIHWVSDINAALEEDRFELFGQLIKPIINHDEAPGVEILLRFKDTDGRLIPPGAFLPAAERYNISTRIDQWVINHTFKWLADNPELKQHLSYIAINLSGLSLGDRGILQSISQHLGSGQIDARMIKFEITETTAISNLTEARQFMNSVKQYGCQFALDDFGSGLSSFAYLKQLPVDVLKIDGVFVKDILDDSIDLAMVKSINEVGHVMGMKTIAEFVENEDIMKRLAEIGVDYAQGYGISRPVPVSELLAQPMLQVSASPPLTAQDAG